MGGQHKRESPEGFGKHKPCVRGSGSRKMPIAPSVGLNTQGRRQGYPHQRLQVSKDSYQSPLIASAAPSRAVSGPSTATSPPDSMK